MEFGETFEDTVRREAVEEVGLFPEKLERLNVYSGEDQHYVYPNGHEVYVVAATFVCDQYIGTLTVDLEECLDARFFALQGFPSRIGNPSAGPADDPGSSPVAGKNA